MLRLQGKNIIYNFTLKFCLSGSVSCSLSVWLKGETSSRTVSSDSVAASRTLKSFVRPCLSMTYLIPAEKVTPSNID